MATRHFDFDALVLRRWPVGEGHRGVAFLTRERGPLNAIAHGAAQSKGRLKLLTLPIRRVRLKAYHDPVADQWKVEDLEALDHYEGLAEVWERVSVATVWAELLTKTQVAGQPCAVYDLFTEALAVVARTEGPRVASVHLPVLWRFLALEGQAPDLTWCADCGRSLAGRPVALPGPDGDPLCPACAGGRGPVLGAEAVDRLLATEIHSLEDCAQVAWTPEVRDNGLQTLLATCERVIGQRLQTLRVLTGGGT